MSEQETNGLQTRRSFVKKTAIGTAALGLSPMILSAADVVNTKKLKVGVIGLGGRGAGAVRDILAADQNTVIWAAGDIFEDRMKKLKKVALLGTKYTMDKTFYKDVLENFGVKTAIPSSEDKDFVNNVIYSELSKGIISDTSRSRYVDIIQELTVSGAEGVILGCTEIPLLVQQSDVAIPVFDTTTIHATEAFNFAIK